MKNFLFSFLITFTALLLFSTNVSADLINPEFYSKTCNPGELEVLCKYKSELPFGPKTYNECAKYENNQSYRFLVGEGHSFGGSSKYCYKANDSDNLFLHHINVLFPLLLITLLLEVPIFLLLISKTKKALLSVLAANLISIPLLYIATLYLPYTGFTTIGILELVVVIFETVFIKMLLPNTKFIKVLGYSFIANAVSAIFGAVILSLVGTILNQLT